MTVCTYKNCWFKARCGRERNNNRQSTSNSINWVSYDNNLVFNSRNQEGARENRLPQCDREIENQENWEGVRWRECNMHPKDISTSSLYK